MKLIAKTRKNTIEVDVSKVHTYATSERTISDVLKDCLRLGACRLDTLSGVYRAYSMATGRDVYVGVAGDGAVVATDLSSLVYVTSHRSYLYTSCVEDVILEDVIRVSCDPMREFEVQLAYATSDPGEGDLFVVAHRLAYPAILHRIGFYMPRLDPSATRMATITKIPEISEIKTVGERLRKVYMQMVEQGCVDGELAEGVVTRPEVGRCDELDLPE